MKRDVRGQEATEFVLISILVFFSALLVVFIFGGKISKFFTQDSAAVKVSKQATGIINPGDGQKYNNDVDPYTGATKTTAAPAMPSTGGTIDLGGQQVTENADGSLSFTASGQNVIISSQMKDLSNAVFQTTGSSGSGDLIKEIAYMIEKHKAEYPTSSVPIQIRFGAGTHLSDPGSLYTGNSVENIVSVIGPNNHAVLIQNDHNCTGGGCNYEGKYRIEWQNNNVSSMKGTGGDAAGQTYSNLQNWTTNNNKYSGECSINNTRHTWNLDFSNNAKMYSI